MRFIFIGLIALCMLMNALTDARPVKDEDDPYEEPAALPYWPFWSSDFWSYVDYFRTLGAYNRINEMARTLFAQYPFGNNLGYDVPYHEH
ncbi:otospiralin [Mauremys mutica]|uniref:otospiralin n=1 Tax=Mauremys mutica TaxID=74926 RepID=UPI001D164677|nr:otospiralin [Mauremys mutica]XP_044887308.1 otospiralin [Mauremys mutica]XP_044887309.1 otospiralin [Mauremys mutica]XP_044887310.1 otospiralin [Mauremys mutica]XP_044887311.1 otospiralin [Mauremys mutica]